MSRQRPGALSRIGTACLAAFMVAGVANGSPIDELANTRHTFVFTSQDIDKILGDIKLSEAHANGAELRDVLPNATMPVGLRTIDGYQNNVTGIGDRDSWGAADFGFPTLAEQAFRNAGTSPGPMGMQTTYDSAGSVWDPQPRIISQLITNQTSQNPVAQGLFDDGAGVNATIPTNAAGIDPATEQAYAFPNAAPDEGLSAPVNAFLTFFGQFFDHGLDLIEKGGNGAVMIPLQADDPLFVEGSPMNFMAMTRATQFGGPGEIVNRTAPLVDQNQTYASHPGVLVLLRDYEMRDGRPEATGRLLNGIPTGEGDDGGMATWADMKANAAKLGIELDDLDGPNMPLIAVDPYGHFLPGANGFPQIVTEGAVDAHRHHDVDYVSLVEGDPDNLVDASDAVRTGQNQLIDIAHGTAPNAAGTYNAALLDRHYVCGDGRCNENIALTAVHHIFHSEHNRLVDFSKAKIVVDAVENNDLDGLNEWLDTPVGALPDVSAPDRLDWDGDRIFSLAKFGTEMQYNRIAFDEFSPTLAGLKDVFEGGPFGYHSNLDPSITAEFSQSVYRFGHSLLTEDIFRFSSGLTEDNSISLFEGFLNPLAFDEDGALTSEQAAGQIIRGLTRDHANELDEFITPALQTNLLGLPLDLAAINIARGRDVGLPRLNAARRTFFDATGATQLQPYASWMDYADNLTHEGSLTNFIAAYGTHASVQAASTFDGRRAAAQALVDGVIAGEQDARDFMYSRGDYANRGDVNITGVDDIDFWVGGLAEERMPFGGYLGSTFNFVFETQMEALQDGDRFYYVGRTGGMDLFNELESNSFTSLIMRNTDAGEVGSGSMHLNIFGLPNHILEVDQSIQMDPAGATALDLHADPTGDSMLIPLVIRDADLLTTTINVPDPGLVVQYTGGDHTTIGGTDGRDTMIGGIGDDAIWGHGGDDRIEGGDGADLILGGEGDDIITDLAGPDVIEGGPGNDAIHSGNEEDVVFGDEGNDFIVNSSELGETFGGDGDDYLWDGHHIGHHRGGAGNDWMENNGGGEELFQGDLGAAAEGGEPKVVGHDVMIALAGNNDFDAENGDDIMVDGPGIERMEGQLGFDWASFQNDVQGVDVDLDLTIFLRPQLPPSNSTIENRYDRVEGISGSPLADILRGSANDPLEMAGNELVDTLDMITGLRGGVIPESEIGEVAEYILEPGSGPRTGWAGGDIILAGAGSDLLVGEGGDDILDGDKSLQVGIDDGTGTVHASAMDLQADIFAGNLPVGNLSISRVIEDRDADGSDTDTAVYSGNRADYVIEGTTDLAGVLTIEDVQMRSGGGAVAGQDGYIRVTDQRTGPFSDGSDLVANIERLQFADEVVVIPEGAAGAADSENTVATGMPVISGDLVVGGRVDAGLGTLADADGITEGNISWLWEAELEPGSGSFDPLEVPVGRLGNGDPFQVQGQSIVLGPEAAGLNIRVKARFQDDAGVFEQANSAPAGVSCDADCLAALPADAIIPVASVVPGGQCADILAEGVVFENASRVGLPRFDFTVPDVPLAAFNGADSEFSPGFGAGAEIAVNGIELVFVDDLSMEVNGTAASEIVAIEILDALGNPTGEIDPANVHILWSIRGGDVSPLVMGATTASLRLDGFECVAIPLTGNSGELDAVGVAQNGAVVVAPPRVVEAPPEEPEAAPVAETVNGTAGNNGRVRIDGTCSDGGEASADVDGVVCATDANGMFRCRGRGIAPGTDVTVTCGGAAEAEAPAAPVSFTAVADGRGRVLSFTGSCQPGEVATSALRCRTNATSGGFVCSGNGFAVGEEVAITCN